jgi:GNAT superfamily N-acetyltransferase
VTGGYIAVATSNNEFVGTYALYVAPSLARSGRPFAVIENVVVHPDFRRRGVGRALLEHAVSEADKLDCYKVMLQTSNSRGANHRFYQACGFHQTKLGFEWRSTP